MGELNIIQKIIIWAVPVIFGITIHEVSHGWVANKLGDPTAKRLGRLTLNPIKHIDPVGTILVPAIFIILPYVNFVFGWAKPVPVNFHNLRNPKRDMALVAAAGPLSNLAMAIFWTIVIRIGLSVGNPNTSMLALVCIYMGWAGIIINLVLMILNLIPLPPLDGSRVVASFLPQPLAWQYNRIEAFGFMILVILLITGVLGSIIGPALTVCASFLLSFFGIPPGIFGL